MLTHATGAVCLTLIGPLLLTQPEDTASRPALDSEDVVLSAEGYPEGVRSEDEYEHYLGETREKLVRAVEDAPDAASRIQANLTLVNWLLARQIEPAASRMALGLRLAEDRDLVAGNAGQALRLLERTAADVEAYQPTGPDEPADRVRQWESVHQTLLAFARCFAALGLPDEESSYGPRRVAAADLAAYLDDPRQELASAARLWQAVLLVGAGQADHAARVLEPTLAPVLEPVSGLFMRLLRARAALAAAPDSDGGRHATAMALLMRLAERCEQIFKTPEQAAVAERTCAWTCWRIGREWTERLESRDQREAAAACRELTARILREHLGEAHPPVVLRLERVIPMLAGQEQTTSLPATSEPAAEPAEPDDLDAEPDPAPEEDD